MSGGGEKVSTKFDMNSACSLQTYGGGGGVRVSMVAHFDLAARLSAAGVLDC